MPSILFIFILSQLSDVTTEMLPGLCGYDFSGPADDVFLMDRTESVSEVEFQNAKNDIKTLVQKRFVLDPSVNRIAVVTFGQSITTEVDYITEDSDKVAPECELFHPGGVFDVIQYRRDDRKMSPDSTLRDMIDIALQVLKSSRRPNVLKRLWVITDFHEFKDSPYYDYDTISKELPGLQVYGIGANVHSKTVEERKQIADRFCNLTSSGDQACSCLYRSANDGTGPSWMDVVESLETLAEKRSPERSRFVRVTDKAICQAHDYSCTGGCQCRQFMTQHDSVRCNDDDDKSSEVDDGERESDSSATLTTIVLSSALAALSILVVILAVILCCKRKLPCSPSFKAVQTSTSDLSYDIEGYVAPTSLFQPTQSRITIKRRKSDGDISNVSVDITGDDSGHYDPVNRISVHSGIDNSLYQMMGNAPGPPLKTRPGYLKNKQKSGASNNNNPGNAIKVTATRPYYNMEHSSEGGKSYQRQSSHLYVEIMPPCDSTYEQLVIKVNPQGGHSYVNQEFHVQNRVDTLVDEAARDTESGYSSTSGSSENLYIKDEKSQKVKFHKSVRTGSKKVKDIASKFVQETKFTE